MARRKSSGVMKTSVLELDTIRTVAKYRNILSGVEKARIRFSYSMIWMGNCYLFRFIVRTMTKKNGGEQIAESHRDHTDCLTFLSRKPTFSFFGFFLICWSLPSASSWSSLSSDSTDALLAFASASIGGNATSCSLGDAMQIGEEKAKENNGRILSVERLH